MYKVSETYNTKARKIKKIIQNSNWHDIWRHLLRSGGQLNLLKCQISLGFCSSDLYDVNWKLLKLRLSY